MTRRPWTHKHGSSQMAIYRLLSGECVVVVVGNYKCYSWIYEVVCSSACTLGFVIHVECRVAPRWVLFSETAGNWNGSAGVSLELSIINEVCPGSDSFLVRNSRLQGYPRLNILA